MHSAAMQMQHMPVLCGAASAGCGEGLAARAARASSSFSIMSARKRSRCAASRANWSAISCTYLNDARHMDGARRSVRIDVPGLRRWQRVRNALEDDNEGNDERPVRGRARRKRSPRHGRRKHPRSPQIVARDHARQLPRRYEGVRLDRGEGN